MRHLISTLLLLITFSITLLAQDKAISENIDVNGTSRNMLVYAPADLPENAPLLISLHGMNQDAAYQQGQAAWENIAKTEKFVVVYPNGINKAWDIQAQTNNKDLNFLSVIIEEMSSRYKINKSRVYLSGFSMGGMMTYFAANYMTDKFAAFAPVSGYLLGGDPVCSSRPIPIIHTHGTTDDVVSYSGVKNILSSWAKRNGCSETPTVITPYPTSNPSSKSSRTTWAAGSAGVEVVLNTLDGKGHWHSNDPANVMTSDEIWDFVKNYSLGPSVVTVTPENGSFDLPVSTEEFVVEFNTEVTPTEITLRAELNGNAVNATIKETEKTKTITITLTNAPTNGAFSLTLGNIKDTSGGVLKSYVITYTFGEDTSAESVASVTKKRLNDKLNDAKSLVQSANALSEANITAKREALKGIIVDLESFASTSPSAYTKAVKQLDDAMAELEDAIKNISNHCLKITTPNAAANIWDWQMHYKLAQPLNKGAEYTLSMRIKASGAGEIALWPIDTNSSNRNEWGNSSDVQYLAAYQMSTEWQTFTWTFTTQYPLNEFDWVFGCFAGDIYFDDVTLIAKGSTDNLIANGDFEKALTSDWEKVSYQNVSYTIVGQSALVDFIEVIKETKRIIEETATIQRKEAIDARNNLIDIVASAETFSSDSDKAYLAEIDKLKKATALLTQWIGVPDSADPNFYIYLCIGQSNMEGAATPEQQDITNVPERFKTMAAVNYTNPSRTKGEWYTAVPPLCRQTSGLCPADYFGRTMVEYLPNEVNVGVINVAIGGTKIEGFMNEYVADYIAGEADWFKNYMANYDNEPYTRLIEIAKRAQAFGVIKGILLHQGESNSGDGTWVTKVDTVYRRILRDLNLYADNVPLLAGEMVQKEQGGICHGHNNVIALLPKSIPTAHVISSVGCPAASDGLHFTAEGYRIIGRRYAIQMLNLMGYDIKDNSPISDITTDSATVVKNEYFDLSGRPVSEASRGIFILRQTLSNGSVITQRVMMK